MVKQVIAINMTYPDSIKSAHAVTSLELDEHYDVQSPDLSY